MSCRLGGSPESPRGQRNSNYKGLGGRKKHKAKPCSGDTRPAKPKPCVCMCVCVSGEAHFVISLLKEGTPFVGHLLCTILSQFSEGSENGLSFHHLTVEAERS